ncbi:MAG: CYTH domain-containing protein [Candidatus Micrarchaeota archaeon]
MPVETEIKIRVKDAAAVRKKLEAAGAAHTKTARQYDGIFDFRDGRLMRRGELFRLRVLEPVWPDGDKTVILTFKGKKKRKGVVKEREETEFETKDMGGAMIALHEMGLEKKMEYLKKTEFYKLGKIKITLDHFPHYPELGHFIELEADEREINRGMRLLGLSKKDAVKETYPELIRNHVGKGK